MGRESKIMPNTEWVKKLLSVDLDNKKIKSPIISDLNHEYTKHFIFGSIIRLIIKENFRSELSEDGIV